MSIYEELRARAAKWFRDKEDRTALHYFEWHDLTAANPDADGLKYSTRDAYHIFGDLINKGLLLPIPVPGKSDTYQINHGNEWGWWAVKHPRRYWYGLCGIWIAGEIASGIVGLAVGATWAWSLCPDCEKAVNMPAVVQGQPPGVLADPMPAILPDVKPTVEPAPPNSEAAADATSPSNQSSGQTSPSLKPVDSP